MTVFGIPRNELYSTNPLSVYGTIFTTQIRDAMINWDGHRVRSIAVAVIAEAAFALLSIVNTIETIASVIAALVVSGAYFIIPPGCKEQFAENVRDPVTKYAVVSLIVTTGTYICLFENCKAEVIDNKAFIKAVDLYARKVDEEEAFHVKERQ